MNKRHSNRITALIAGATLAAAAGCVAEQRVIDSPTADGPARRVIRIVESVEAAGSTTLVAASETSPEQASYAPLFDAFAELSPRVCTGTHLGGGVVLTAGHCMEDPPPDNRPRFARTIDDDQCLARVDGVLEKITMKWGRRYGRPAYLQSECSRIVAWEWTDERDFAVLIVSPTGGKLPRARVVPSFDEPSQLGDLTVFSFPKAMALRWSGVCKLGDPAGGVLPYFFHTCSTDGGSSGAAMIDGASRKVVGLHLGQWGLKGPNYAMYLSDPVVTTHVLRAFAQVAARDVAPELPERGPAAR